MNNTTTNTENERLMEIREIIFTPQIKKDCKNESTEKFSNIIKSMGDLDYCNYYFFPNGWFLSNKVSHHINKSPKLYECEYCEDRYECLVEFVKDDILILRNGVFYPKYNIYGDEYTEHQIDSMEIVHQLTKEIKDVRTMSGELV